MCRSGAGEQTPSQASATRTCKDSQAEAAAQYEPNLPRSRKELNLDRSLSVFLLDWDDTLFPTTALTSFGPEAIEDVVEAIDTVVAEIIESLLATAGSRVIILTNANLSWVHHCAETFMPKVNALLRAEDSQLTLMSAHRDRAEFPESDTAAYEDAVRKSKSEAVRPLATALQQLAAESQIQSLQVVGVGDQPHDHAAAHALRGLMCLEESFVKTVAMKPMPTAMELSRQLGTLCKSLPTLSKAARSSHQSMCRTSPVQTPRPCRTQAVPVVNWADPAVRAALEGVDWSCMSARDVQQRLQGVQGLLHPVGVH